MNSIEIRAAASLACIYVLRMLGLFMVIPVLAILATDFTDYSPWLLGLAIGGYGLTQACLQIPMGLLSDRWGRKPVIVTGLLLFALGSLIAASAESMTMLVVGRMLQGMGAIAGAVMALAADVSREQQRPKVMAIIGISIGFSFYLSLLIGPPIASSYGLAGIFAGTCILALLCIPLVLFAVPKASNHAPAGDTLPNFTSLKSLFRQAQLTKLNISVFSLHFMITLLFVVVPPKLIQLQLAINQHWQFYLPILIASVLAMVGLMKLSHRQGQKSVLLFSVILLGLAFFGMAVVEQNLVLLILLIWLFFSGFNYLEANLPAIVSTLAPAGQKGSAMGIYASFQFFGAFAGGVAAGGLSSWLGETQLLILTTIICIVWLALVYNMTVEEKTQRYTLPVNFSAHQQEEVLNRLQALEGIKEISLIPSDNAVYLKVDSKHFKLKDAKALFN